MLDPLSRQTMDRPYKCHLCVFSSFSTQGNARIPTSQEENIINKSFLCPHLEMVIENTCMEISDKITMYNLKKIILECNIWWKVKFKKKTLFP